MGNTPSQNIEKNSNIIYEFVEIDEKKYKEYKYNYEILQNDLCSKNTEISYLKERLDKLEKSNNLLNSRIDIYEIKLKDSNNNYNELKNNYDSLEYTKLDIEEKYLNLLDINETVDYYKNNNDKLEKELKDYIVKYNDESNMTEILNETLNTTNKSLHKFKNLYDKTQVEYNTLKSSHQELKKNNKNILKINSDLLVAFKKKLDSKLFKKELYQYLEKNFKGEPFVYNQVIETIIKLVLDKCY